MKKFLIAVMAVLSFQATAGGPIGGALGAATYCAAACLPSGVTPAGPLGYGVCYAACVAGFTLACFSEDTQVIVYRGEGEKTVSVSDINPGDMVQTLEHGRVTKAAVLRNIKSEGKYEFVELVFDDRILTVTPGHGIVVLSGSGELIMKKAKLAQIGDKLISAEGLEKTILSVNFKWLKTKHTLETLEGTVLASGLLVSTICEQEIGQGFEPFEQKISDWRSRHAGIGIH